MIIEIKDIGELELPDDTPEDKIKELSQRIVSKSLEVPRDINSGSAKVADMEDTPDNKNFFNSFMDTLFKHEGGYVNDPDDKGGATNLGVTIGALKKFLGRDVAVEEVKNLKPEVAKEIYHKEYYNDTKINQLPKELHAVVLDHAINAGPATAIRLLQRMIGAEADGHIGPETIEKATKLLEDRGVTETINSYVAKRKNYYQSVALSNPTQKKFLKGWLNRADSFTLT